MLSAHGHCIRRRRRDASDGHIVLDAALSKSTETPLTRNFGGFAQKKRNVVSLTKQWCRVVRLRQVYGHIRRQPGSRVSSRNNATIVTAATTTIAYPPSCSDVPLSTIAGVATPSAAFSYSHLLRSTKASAVVATRPPAFFWSGFWFIKFVRFKKLFSSSEMSPWSKVQGPQLIIRILIFVNTHFPDCVLYQSDQLQTTPY